MNRRKLYLTRIYRIFRYDWPLHFVLIFTNWLPDNSIFLRLRGFLVTPFWGKCGRNLKLQHNITFYNPMKIRIGSNVRIAYGTRFLAGGEIVLGDEVIVGPYCVIVSSSHSRRGQSFRDGEITFEPVYVGRGAWIAAHVTVIAGSKIGNGTLIAANSVVRGDIPDNVLAAGQPAKVIRHYDN